MRQVMCVTKVTCQTHAASHVCHKRYMSNTCGKSRVSQKLQVKHMQHVTCETKVTSQTHAIRDLCWLPAATITQTRNLKVAVKVNR